MKDLKRRYLVAIGHASAEGESATVAFDALRVRNPDAFPIPREGESFNDACAEVVLANEARAS